ncbi:MAG: DoxX family protein [Patescibacteria group bacterium]
MFTFTAGFIVGRLLFGGYFFMMGLNHFFKHKMLSGYAKSKGVPFPEIAVAGSGLLIFLGGLGTALGMFPQVSAVLISIFLLFVTPKMHAFWKETDPNMKMMEMVQFMKNTALFGASLMIAF